MKLTRILHHSVNVESRLDDTLAFYRDVIGLSSTDRPDIPGVAGAWLTIADAQVHLVDAGIGDDAIRPTDAHVCFGVEDLNAAIAELEDLGIPYERGAQGPVAQIWINDPAGNIIELQQD